MSTSQHSAIAEFHTSSYYDVPKGYDAWLIRNDYPAPYARAQGGPIIPSPGQLPPGNEPTPWLDVDFKTDPNRYIQLIKEYFMEGMLESNFVPQKNNIRQWYHAPWMHRGDSGREPLRGLTAERFTPPYEFAAGQKDWLQSWAVGFFNAPAASVLGQVWANPSLPEATKSLQFPKQSVIVKTLFSDATDEQVPSQKGSPAWEALISASSDYKPVPRNKDPSPVRLIQMDIAVTDPKAPLGWVFGTFMYNGLGVKSDSTDKLRKAWDRLIPVGLMWGDDPQLNQEAFKAGEKPQASWINPEANLVLKELGGKRPFWGWNGRLNGPADNFISACMSCHAMAQVNIPGKGPGLVPPAPKEGPPGVWTPANDKETMEWFQDFDCGQPVTTGAVSTDYNLQVMIGLNNYQSWAKELAAKTNGSWGAGENEWEVPKAHQHEMLRSGPTITYM